MHPAGPRSPRDLPPARPGSRVPVQSASIAFHYPFLCPPFLNPSKTDLASPNEIFLVHQRKAGKRGNRFPFDKHWPVPNINPHGAFASPQTNGSNVAEGTRESAVPNGRGGLRSNGAYKGAEEGQVARFE